MGFTRHKFFFREKEIEAFNNFIDNFGDSERTLFYFGKAGVGKTELKNILESSDYINEKGFVKCSVNIEPEGFRNPDLGLLAIRKKLIEECGIEFPTFDVIYNVMIEKSRAGLLVDGRLKTMRDSVITSSVINTAGPGMQADFLNKLSFALKKDDKEAKKWWGARGRFLALGLASSSVEELRRKLIYAFAGDLNNALKNESKKVLIFIDNFDSMGGGDDSQEYNCSWIFSLAEKVKNSGWVLFSRIRPYNDDVKKVHMHAFDGEEIKNYLAGYGVKISHIADIISHASRGLPIYLKLGAEIYNGILQKDKEEPTENDIELDISLQVQRYLSLFDQESSQFLRILAVARYFDKELFDHLHTEYLLAGVGFTFGQIKDLPFVEEQSGILRIHPLIREELIKLIDGDNIENIKFSIFDFYNTLIQERLSIFDGMHYYYVIKEAYALAVDIFDMKGLTDWFSKVREKAFSWDKLTFWSCIVGELAQHVEKVFGIMNGESVKIHEAYASLKLKEGFFDTAENILKRMMEVREKLFGEKHPESLKGLEKLADLYEKKGDFVSAEACFKDIMLLKQDIYGAQSKESLEAINHLAKIKSDMGETDEAESLLYRVQKNLQKSLGKSHPDTLKSMNALAGLVNKNGDIDKAANIYREIVSLTEDQDDTAVSASASGKLAAICLKMGTYAEAESMFIRSLNSRKSVFGENHSSVAACMNNMAYLFYKKGDYEAASKLFKDTLELKQKNYGETHPSVTSTLANIASVDYALGNFDSAVESLNEALKNAELSQGSESRLSASILNNLGLVYSRKGDLDKAEDFYKRAELIKKELNDGEIESLAITIGNIAELKFRKGETADAVELYEDALQLVGVEDGIDDSELTIRLKENLEIAKYN